MVTLLHFKLRNGSNVRAAFHCHSQHLCSESYPMSLWVVRVCACAPTTSKLPRAERLSAVVAQWPGQVLHTHTHTHTYSFVSHGNGTEEKVFKEDLKDLTEVEWRTKTGSWFQIVAGAAGLCSEGWYSEHSGVCRRTEQQGRSVNVKLFWKGDGGLMRIDLKAKQRELYSIFCLIGSQYWRLRMKHRSQVTVGGSGWLAALFCKFWSLERRYLGQPAKKRVAVI